MKTTAIHPIIYVRGYAMTSDGLVRIKNSTTRGRSKDGFVYSPHAFVHRSHSGFFGIVNSEEGYQNLVRFLFGDVRADGTLEIDELTLPPAVQEKYEEDRDIKASYLFEVSVSVRGKTCSTSACACPNTKSTAFCS